MLGERDVTYDDLARLPYTDGVIQEAMRLYPPVYSLARRAHEDTEIGGYRVKAGSEVVLWIYMTHRDPRWWPEPDAFRPERFTPEEEERRPKLAYAPFGAGPRACIGKVFATVEARLLLATLAQRHRLELARSLPVQAKPRITLVPKGGMRMDDPQRAVRPRLTRAGDPVRRSRRRPARDQAAGATRPRASSQSRAIWAFSSSRPPKRISDLRRATSWSRRRAP